MAASAGRGGSGRLVFWSGPIEAWQRSGLSLSWLLLELPADARQAWNQKNRTPQ